MKTLLIVVLIFTSINAFEKNPYFSSEAQLEMWFWDSTTTGTEKRLMFFLTDTSGGKAVWKIETRCFCELDWSVYVLYDWNNDSILCGHGFIAGIDFGGDEFDEECRAIELTNDLQKRSSIIARHFIRKNRSESLNNYVKAEDDSYNTFKKSKDAVYRPLSALYVVHGKYWHYLPIDSDNVIQYNDLGFFLEQGGKYSEAVTLLSEVVKAFPDRVVAYLNLADAYWGLADRERAQRNYCRYKELMQAGKLDKKIPARVFERCEKGS